jgi:hypothetical protein
VSLPLTSLSSSLSFKMSPIALPSQHAVVLHGKKDLRLEERTLWPPHHNQAQVLVISTGLCGSDRQLRFHPSSLLTQLPSQFTIIKTERTGISLSRHQWFSVTSPLESLPQSVRVLNISFQASASLLRPVSCAVIALGVKKGGTTSANQCVSAAVHPLSPIRMAPCRTA